ncbi:hypothetical protein CAC42_3276 [Sphaceloma murrayae]|uniref:Uncharacterized protein n=1 Tax=Sphaceloma murrayae TaxID=2082308 RepID=A0A2K1QFY7_9PEZI|nr:hypothetical protein CAC42_3276 [Sphaceloma murrayae]
MRSALLLATVAALASAVDLDPTLDIDWDLVLSLDPVPTPVIPVVYKTDEAPASTSEKVTYAASSAAAAVASAAVDTAKNELSDPIVLLPDTPSGKRLRKRDAALSCVTQPLGAGPVPAVDTAAEFLNDTRMSAFANKAETPAGYVKTFTNKQASNNAYGYMGYTLLPAYNATLCANKCTAILGCQSFNLYFERNPIVDPNDNSCPDPASTTNIKCVFWGGPVAESNALNSGQYRSQFQVVIAGSNGYVNSSIATPAGYQMPVFLGTSAINAPASCPGKPSRLVQSNAFQASAFDVKLCSTACSEQKAWARTQPNMRQCNYFNTYLLYKNNKPLAQYCAMYDEMWTGTYAKNTGYSAGSDKYTIAFSYTSWNVTDQRNGVEACPKTV